MNDRDLAKLIINRFTEGQNRVVTLKRNIEELLEWLLRTIREITGEIPDEQKFIDVVAEILDLTIQFPQPLEAVDGLAVRSVLRLMNKYVLTQILGQGWYQKITQKIKKMLGDK